MANVHDVAAFILQDIGPTTTMKLEKLVFYSQAWSIVWDGEPLFSATIQAWKDGPVVPDVFRYHKGKFQIDGWSHGNPGNLTPEQIATVKGVLAFYGDREPSKLVEISHRERPWRDARRGLLPDERGEQPITVEAIREYYGSIPTDGQKVVPAEYRRGLVLLLNTPEDDIDALYEDADVKGEDVVHWLQTGEGDPWHA